MSETRQPLLSLLPHLSQVESAYSKPLERFKAELEFAIRMTAAKPDRREQWEPLLAEAAELVIEGLETGQAGVEQLVSQAEQILEPLGEAAKQYTIYCCGHGHLDMNWMWPWPETVAACYDMFITVDRLMDEFPQFRFTQSQASLYHAMHEHAPEVFQRVMERTGEGRWEVAASQWVEADKNMVGGESLCRHLLYTRRWLQEVMGLPYDHVKIGWEPDTFGHPWTLPGILRRGGVQRYYIHRSSAERPVSTRRGETPQLFWWEGRDGSRILVYDDSHTGYNNEIAPHMTNWLFDMERHTGLKILMWVYGVGDHGGGPTRRHLRAAEEMMSWPIWPRIRLTTSDDFFSEAERLIREQNLQVPVHRGELNFVFEGCYTSQSRVKFANRKGESRLIDTEIAALLASRLEAMPYPSEQLREAWRRAMFLQFHDILPGSGVRETIEHAMGEFQNTMASTGMILTRAVRQIAAAVDTSRLASSGCADETDLGLGAGVGIDAWWGDISSAGVGERGIDRFVVFNPAPFERDEIVRVKVWNRELPDRVIVRDSDGRTVPGQVTERSRVWGHTYARVAFPARALPAVGYRAYTVEASAEVAADSAVFVREEGRSHYRLGYGGGQPVSPVTIGNECLEVTISPEAGGIVSLIDRRTGWEMVPQGQVLGAISRQQEVPHGMTAWLLAPTTELAQPLRGGKLTLREQGPHVASVELSAPHNESEYRLVISVAAGRPGVDFALEVNWLERGDPDTGVPVLRALFPLALKDGRANHEIPFGSIERPADGWDAPALTWVDLTGVASDAAEQPVGAALVNDCKYGHGITSDTIALALLRSSYDPDPLPELGRHQIRYALLPHAGPLELAEALKAGYAFNHPVIPVATTVHEGELPPEAGALEVLTPNVMVAALKRAEEGEGTILRLFEFEGRDTQAQVRLSQVLASANAPAVETDLLEEPLAQSTARMNGDVLQVQVPAYGIATVRIG